MSVAPSFCDESEHGFGWISATPAWMGRASHALAADGGVWLVDPVDFAGLDERVGSLGEVQAVLQLLDRHARDCAAIAARLDVPHLVVPGAVPGSPFEAIAVTGAPGWHETALWWPARRTLVVTEAVGTSRYFRARRRPLGVHPYLRFFAPPTALVSLEPEHILCGHGRGVHEDASEALRSAVAHARSELPAQLPRLALARRHPYA